MAKILVIREEEWERLQHYAQVAYGSGGWQNLCRKLVSRLVETIGEVETVVSVTNKAEADAKRTLFG